MRSCFRLLVPLALLGSSIQAVVPAEERTRTDVFAKIHELKCRKQAQSVNVSFRIEGALTPEVRSNLERGLLVTFTHDLTVVRRRALFFDKALARQTIETTARLDTLTQQYTLTRSVEGVVRETSITDRFEDMQRWMTEIRDAVIPLPPSSLRGSLEVRPETEYQNDFLLWLLPWGRTAEPDDPKECR